MPIESTAKPVDLIVDVVQVSESIVSSKQQQITADVEQQVRVLLFVIHQGNTHSAKQY